MTSLHGVAPERDERIVVAMSGGVDSSLAAALAVERGCDVIAVTMQLSGSESRCCSLADADDARRVANALGVKFYVANYADLFRKEVIEAFADDYLAGRTPIPCVACNKRFKFDHLLARAKVFGASRVATGHYARTDRDPQTGLVRLRRARDLAKDQTYFLFQLDQVQLEQAWFPLGEMTKPMVRERARALGLATADKPESQEICFVPDGRYVDVVERVRPEALERSGEFVDETGRVLGRHPGVHHFTVGQRHGLGLSSATKLYVSHIDADTRRVTVGDASALDCHSATVAAVNWIAGTRPDAPVRVRVQVRHGHVGASATLLPEPGDRAIVKFDDPVRAATPGQAAVFYADDPTDGGNPANTSEMADGGRGEVVLGGGFIESTTRGSA